MSSHPRSNPVLDTAHLKSLDKPGTGIASRGPCRAPRKDGRPCGSGALANGYCYSHRGHAQAKERSNDRQ